MFKKVFSTFAAAAFMFGSFSKVNVLQNFSDACSYVCCEHDGDVWDN